MAQTDWKTLKERARDYNYAAETLCTAGQWQNALEQAHFSVELAFKAAITKADYGPYPDTGKKGHDLLVLSGCQIRSHKGTLRSEARKNRGIRRLFNEVISAAAWQMHHRYEKMPLDPASFEDLVEKYGRIYQWVMMNYVES